MIVRYGNHNLRACQELAFDKLSSRRIQCRKTFVQKKQIRISNQRSGRGNPLFFAA